MGHGQYMCEVSSLYAKRILSSSVEMVKSSKSKYDLDLLTPKSIEVLSSRSIQVWSIIIVCRNEMELSCGNSKKSKSKFD